MKHIAVLTGGVSDERVVSLKSAHAVEQALVQKGYDVTTYLFPEEVKSFVAESDRYDFAWVMVHGRGGEDGQIAGLLDLLNVPYQCTSPDVLSLTMDKRLTKQVGRQANVPVARDVMMDDDMSRDQIRDILSGFSFRCVCKALDQGSSQGVVIVDSEHQVDVVCALVQQYGRVMCEAFLEGSECTVAILDGEVLPVVEIVPPEDGGFDFINKYNGQTQEICPARYDDVLTRQVQQVALEAYRAVGCTSYGRVDVIVCDGQPYLLEINTIPGFTDQSLFPLAARTAGIDFGDLCERLMTIA